MPTTLNQLNRQIDNMDNDDRSRLTDKKTNGNIRAEIKTDGQGGRQTE